MEGRASQGQKSRGVGGWAAGLLIRAVAFPIATVSLLWQNATKDGHLGAAARQGIDELGQALKAFPESIQVQEVGGLFEPTQGEVASNRRDNAFGHGQGLRSPSQIAHGRSAMYGRDEAHGKLRSPSEIAADRSGREAELGHGRERDHGHDIG